MNHRIPEELIEFIKESPTAFHAVSAMAARLTESGFIRLEEGMHWNLKQGGSYYVTRNDRIYHTGASFSGNADHGKPQ